MKKNIIFLDDDFVEPPKVLLESLAPVHLSGKGVFETMKAVNGNVVAVDLHLKRFFAGLKQLGIKSPYSRIKIKSYLDELLKRNGLKEARLRLTVWEIKGRVHISMCAFKLSDGLRLRNKKGSKAVFYPKRYNEKKLDANLKSIDYGFYHRAYQYAVRRKCDEAIILNQKGDLVEGSRTNLFFVKNSILYTPHDECGCLGGITRGLVLKAAKDLGLMVSPSFLSKQDLLAADEAFLTNSISGVVPLLSVDGKAIGNAKEGPLTTKIARAYRIALKKF